MEKVLKAEKPSLVLVHGDTTTAFAASLACFYQKIPVGHVEAGLRTYNKSSPYPEEFNRCAVSALADLHFAPTEQAVNNLLREDRVAERIFMTGNTVMDALATTVRTDYTHPTLEWAMEAEKWVLVTAHRRENVGKAMRGMFRAIRRVLAEHENVRAVYPVHPAPAVRRIAAEELGGCEQIRMIEPLDVVDFHNFLARCFFVLSDSGGIQEEAPALGKPVLLMRDTTERPEGVIGGGVKLIGTEQESVYKNFARLLEDGQEYRAMSRAKNPYGDGRASARIADIIEELL
jgi:UDP-N-acetylglucosamine 2-epimerase (non-hydrolysing)